MIDPRCEIILIRHGVALHNVAARRSGEHEYFNEEWKYSTLVEPETDGNRVHQTIMKTGIDIRDSSANIVCYTSPLIRTIDTMRFALKGNKTYVKYGHDDLIERQGNGHPCNLRESPADLKRKHPDIKFFHTKIGDGLESPEDPIAMKLRVDRMIDDHVLGQLAKGATVLLFSHHDTIRALSDISLRNAECIAYNVYTGSSRKL